MFPHRMAGKLLFNFLVSGRFLLSIERDTIDTFKRFVGGDPVAFLVTLGAIAFFAVLDDTCSTINTLDIQSVLGVCTTIFFAAPTVLVEELEVE